MAGVNEDDLPNWWQPCEDTSLVGMNAAITAEGFTLFALQEGERSMAEHVSNFARCLDNTEHYELDFPEPIVN